MTSNSMVIQKPMPVHEESPKLSGIAPAVRSVPAAPPQPAEGELVTVAISALAPADSPRLHGEDTVHARLLADTEAELPPILVHRRSLKVIDGMHRVRAALMRGETTVRARLFDGSEDAAFVQAVRANIAHGLPLSLADRQAAAARILQSFPQWSNRAVASTTGLSGKTVGAIRRQVVTGELRTDARIGRDGRVRPLDCRAARQRASELLALHPDATLRELAKASGISLGTARDVRDRVRRGESPFPPRQRRGDTAIPRPAAPVGRVAPGENRTTILQNLRRDPSLRFNESGRDILRWLDARAVGATGWQQLADAIPPHCAYVIADFAHEIAQEWLDVAETLRRRAEAAS